MDSAIVTGSIAVVTAVNAYLLLQIKLAIADMKLELARERAADMEHMREWINGSFMRAKEVKALIEGLHQQQ